MEASGRFAHRLAELKKQSVWNFETGDWYRRVGPVGGEPPADRKGFRPVTSPRFGAPDGEGVWVTTRYRVPKTQAGEPTEGSEAYLTGNVVVGPVTVYVNGEKVFYAPFWTDLTRPEIPLTAAARPGEEFEIWICLHPSPNLVRGNTVIWPEIKIRRIEERIFDLECFEHEMRYMERFSECRALCRAARERMDHVAEGGTLSRQAETLAEIRAAFEPFRALAKSHEVYVIAHAHIDIDWQWPREDTYNACLDTFKTMCDLGEEFDDFVFSQSQTALYEFAAERDPVLFERIRKNAAAGRWDVSNACRLTETDLNAPDGETLAASLKYGIEYVRKHFGKRPTVCHEPDAFGHPETMPQILQKSGIRHYFRMRGDSSRILHRWEGPDGSRVLTAADQYKSPLDVGRLIRNVLRFETRLGLPLSLYMFGVGDHGGGPSRQEIRALRRLNELPTFPRLRFSDMESFYRDAERKAEEKGIEIPVFRGEAGPVFEGCYTSHGDIKEAVRELENRLRQADFLTALIRDRGRVPDEAFLDRCRKHLILMLFHDTICGCSVASVYERAVAETKAVTDELKRYLESELQELVEPADDGFAVWNSEPFARSEPVRLPADWGAVELFDEAGNPVPVQKAGDERIFLAENLPPLGFRTYRFRPAASESGEEPEPRFEFETDYFRVAFHPETGILEKLEDKAGGFSYLHRRDFTAEPSSAYPYNHENNLFTVSFERPHRRSAWVIGPVSRTENLTEGTVRRISSGPVAQVLEITRRFRESTLVQRVYVYQSLPRIDFCQRVDWKEVGTAETDAPMLTLRFRPEPAGHARASFEIPFGVRVREPDGLVRACRRWADLSDDELGFTVVNDGRYGCAVRGTEIELHCIRSSYEPDPRAGVGEHRFAFALYPHAGPCDVTEARRRGAAFNAPPVLIRGAARGVCPPVMPQTRAGVSVIKSTPKGTVVRLAESEGRETPFAIRTRKPVKRVAEIYLTEDEEFGEIPADEFEVRGTLAPHEIKTLLLEMAE